MNFPSSEYLCELVLFQTTLKAKKKDIKEEYIH